MIGNAIVHYKYIIVAKVPRKFVTLLQRIFNLKGKLLSTTF